MRGENGSPPSEARSRRRLDAAGGYLALGMPDHALAELDAAADPPRLRFDLRKLRGDVLRQAGRFAEADRAYAAALAERPDALPVLFSRADCLRRTGDLTAAVEAMEAAHRAHPDEPAVVYALARYCVLAGARDRSLAWLEQAVRLCPDVGPHAAADRDFAPLRPDPRFRRLVASAARRAA